MTMDRWSKRLVRWAHRPGFRSPGAPGTRKWGRERWYKLVAVCTTAALLNLGLATQNVLDAAELTKQNRGQLRQFYGSVAAADERAEQQGTAAPPEDPLAALGLGGGDPFGGLGASDPFGLGLDASIPGMPKLPALPADPTSSAIPGMPSIPGLFGASGPQGPAGIKPPSAPAAAQQPETEETERVPLGVSLDRLSSQLRKLRTVSGAARTAPETYASTWKSVQSIDQDAERASTKLRANGARANRIGGAIATRQKALEERFDAARQKLHGQVESFQKALETQRFEEANGIGQEIDTTLRSLKLQAGPTRGKSPLPHFAPKIEERSIPAGVAKSSGGRAPAKCLDCGEPTQADRDTTPETDATSEIAALAASLDRDPARIYHWVLNNVDFVPTWGSIQGAGATLASRRGNAVDQASLLISLLRASGIPCRYVHGSVNIPGPQLASWLGTTDVSFAVEQLSRNGVASQLHYAGGTVGSVDLEHAWVRAWVRYAPHRGIDKGVGDRWVDIDPSFKAVSVHRQRDVTTEIGVDPVNFLRQIKAQSTINASESWVKDVPEQLIINRIDDWGTAVDRYAEANGFTNATLYGSRAIQQKDLQILPLELPYTVLSEIESEPEVDDALKTSLSLKLSDANGTVLLDRELELCSMAGKRLTLRFEPSTGADQSVIDAYRNEEAFPVYLVDVKPALKLEGAVVGDEYGTPVGMGQPLSLEMVLDGPLFDEERFTSSVTAGAYSALVFDLQGTSQRQLEERIGELRLAKEKLQAGTPGDMDTYLGEALHCIGLSYWRQLDGLDELAGGGLGLEVTRQVSQLITSYSLNVTELFGLPFEAAGGPVTLSVDRDAIIPLSITGDENKEIQYHAISALTSSVLEHSMLEQALGGQGISTIRLLQEANKAGAKTYTFTTANQGGIDAALFNLPSALVQDVKDAVNAGRTVTVPNEPASFAGFEGAGWIAFDPQTGAAGLFVDGDLAGGVRAMTTLKAADVLSPATASTYVPLVTPGIEWIELASSIIERSGFRYVPAVAAIGQWFANAIDLDDASFLAAGIALSGPLSLIASRPHIGKVVVTPEVFSPNADTVKDAATISALLSRESEWLVEIRNAAQEVTKHWEGTGKVIELTWTGLGDDEQPADDGRYTVRFTATAVGLETPAIPVDRPLILDKTDPTAEFVQPENNAEVRGNVSLIGTADDDNLEAYTLEYGVGENPTSWTPIVADSTSVVIQNSLGIFNGYRNANGTYTFRVRASDMGGNQAQATRRLVLNDPDNDITAPVVELQAPEDDDDVTGEVTIRAHATDNGTLERVILSVDGETVEEWTEVEQDDIYETTIDTVTLRNGAHIVSAVAVDARGNQGHDESDVTSQNAISEFTIEPNPFTPNADGWQDTTSIAATLDPPGPWTLEIMNGADEVAKSWSGSGAGVLRSWDGRMTDGNDAPEGSYTAHITAGANTAQAPIQLDLTDAAPNVSFTLPVEGQKIDGLIEVRGLVTDSNLTGWELTSRSIETDSSEVLADGTAAPSDGRLGMFDATTRRNGGYELTLTATDAIGQVVSTTILVWVDGHGKVGAIGFSQDDTTILVHGMPITVRRTYSSFNSNVVGDFGNGWSLSLIGMEIDEHARRSPGETQDGTPCEPRVGGSRDVSLTLPDGRRTTFNFDLRRQGDQLTYRAYYVSPPGIEYELSTITPQFAHVLPTYSSEVNYYVWGGGTWDEGLDYYEIPGYVLRAADGTRYIIEKPIIIDGPETILFDDGDVREVSRVHGPPRLTSIIDANGNTLTVTEEGIFGPDDSGLSMTRNGDGLITSVTQPSGEQVAYGYEGTRLVTVTDQENHVTHYSYGSDGRLSDIVTPDGNRPVVSEFDDSGRITAIVDAKGNRIRFEHALSGRHEIVVDRLGNPTTYEYDERGLVVTMIDALGRATHFEHDAAGRLTRHTAPGGRVTQYSGSAEVGLRTITDALGNVTTFEFNAAQNLTRTTEPGGHITTSEYDDRGNRTRSVDPLGNEERWTYDSAGRVTSYVDKMGAETTYEFDGQGRLERIVPPVGSPVVHAYDDDGRLVSETRTRTGPNGQPQSLVTSFAYDGVGRLIRSTDAEGLVQETVYGLNGRIVERRVGGNVVESNDYDERGLLIQTTHADGTFETITYDVEGRRVSRTDRRGGTWLETLDALGRVVREVAPDGSSIEISHDLAGNAVLLRDQMGNATRREFDVLGRVIKTIDPTGAETRHEYDAAGNLVRTIDALNRTWLTEYDAVNRPVRRILPDGATWTTSYDANGRVISTTDPIGRTTTFEYCGGCGTGGLSAVVDPASGRWDFTHDEVGNRTLVRDAEGRESRWEYDRVGRVTRAVLPEDSEWNYTYDDLGRLETLAAPGSVEMVYEYDVNGRVAEISIPAENTSTSFEYLATGELRQVVENGLVRTRDHDALGRVVRETSPDGYQVSNQYDAAGRRVRFVTPFGSTQYRYGSRGELVEVTDASGGVATASWDSGGRLTSLQRSNGTATTFAYDALNRVLQVESRLNSTDQVISRFTYERSLGGQITSVTDLSGLRVAYTRDALDRIVLEEEFESGSPPATHVVERHYDKVSNCTYRSVDGVATTWTYDDQDRMSLSQGPDGQTSFTFDGRGNLQTLVGPDETRSLTWDARDRLREVSWTRGSESGEVAYSYSDDGVLAERQVAGQEATRFRWDRSSSIPQLIEKQTGVDATHYAHGLGRLNRVSGGERSWFHQDAVGSTRAVTSDEGAVEATGRFDAFGAVRTTTGSQDDDLLFGSGLRDGDLGTDYMLMRHFDPSLGIFLSRDPASGTASRPVTFNDYAYASQDPLTYADPTGQQSVILIAMLVIIGLLLMASPLGDGTVQWCETQGKSTLNPGKPVKDAAKGWFFMPFTGYFKVKDNSRCRLVQWVQGTMLGEYGGAWGALQAPDNHQAHPWLPKDPKTNVPLALMTKGWLIDQNQGQGAEYPVTRPQKDTIRLEDWPGLGAKSIFSGGIPGGFRPGITIKIDLEFADALYDVVTVGSDPQPKQWTQPAPALTEHKPVAVWNWSFHDSMVVPMPPGP